MQWQSDGSRAWNHLKASLPCPVTAFGWLGSWELVRHLCSPCGFWSFLTVGWSEESQTLVWGQASFTADVGRTGSGSCQPQDQDPEAGTVSLPLLDKAIRAAHMQEEET